MSTEFAKVCLALGSFATGGSQAIRIPRPRSPESRPSSHPKATIDRCIAVTHAADQKADINCNASKEKGGSFSRPPSSLT
jgi:hypothetical protein